MGPLQRNLSLERGAGLLFHAYQKGITFIDTAELYDTYKYVGELLRQHPDLRKDLVIVAKSYSYDEKTARDSLNKALREMKTDYIDIFLLHEQESVHTLRGHGDAIEYFLKKKEEGIIGKIGISTHFISGVNAAAKDNRIEVIHPIINMRGLGIQDGTRQEMEQALTAAKAEGKIIYAMKALGGGHMINERKAAFDYIMNLDCIDSVAIGMQTESEIDYNSSYIATGKVTDELEQIIEVRERKMIIHDWCIGCGSCEKRCDMKAIKVIGDVAVVDPDRCVFCGYCATVCPEFCIKVI